MSVYSNPASGAKAEADAYIEAVLGLLGHQDPMAVLRGTPAAARRLTLGLTVDELRRPESEGKWSPVEVLQHLADSELVWGYRLRRVLAEDRPVLAGYDQDLWAQRLHYPEADAEQALAMFETLRQTHVALLGRASLEDLARVGIHEERGEESLSHMVRLYAGHDLVHRRQLARIRARLRGALVP